MNLLQAKALFFAQYLGQEVYINEEDHEIDIHYVLSIKSGINQITLENAVENNHYALFLRSYKQLTAQEYVIVSISSDWMSKDEMYDSEHLVNGRYIVSQFKKGEAYDINVYQYLQRIGILLPFIYLDEDNKPKKLQPNEIIHLGWVKYHKNEKYTNLAFPAVGGDRAGYGVY